MQLKTKRCVAIFIINQLLTPFHAQAASYKAATWDESGGRIALKTVCANHKYGSIKSRECRAMVSKHFHRQCKRYAQKYSAASTKNRAKYKTDKSKYCYAARHFRIVN